jgi:alkyl sulfatase BDS1-like metallo-beta-lactamase superfamily hydrolase
VYAHASTLDLIDRFATITFASEYVRGMRQFGAFLPPDAANNAGIGPFFSLGDLTSGYIRPNKTFAGDHSSLEIAGIKLEVYLAPGETPDQIFIWLPEKKVLLPADNYYSAFTNLYTIRGSPYRDAREWVKSLNKMRALKPEYLVPSHTRPVTGTDQISQTLTNYRDAIKFVHDQTIRGINLGLTAHEIVERVKLPPRLAQQPYLQEYYGTVEWSVRGILDGNVGWFDGNATNLFRLPLKAHAEEFAELAGGQTKLLERAQEAVAGGKYQWALELLDQLFLLDPSKQEVRSLKSQALTALAGEQISANARNYYLTQALEVNGTLQLEPVKPNKAILDNIALQSIFDAMPVRLDPVKSADTNTVVGFRFPDIGEAFTVHVRQGVAEVESQFPDKPDIVVTANSSVCKEIVAGLQNPVGAFANGDVQVAGNPIDLVKFLSLFQ